MTGQILESPTRGGGRRRGGGGGGRGGGRRRGGGARTRRVAVHDDEGGRWLLVAEHILGHTAAQRGLAQLGHVQHRLAVVRDALRHANARAGPHACSSSRSSSTSRPTRAEVRNQPTNPWRSRNYGRERSHLHGISRTHFTPCACQSRQNLT